MSGRVLWRAIWSFVLLDTVTFVLIDWIALPTIGPRLGDLPVPVIETVLWAMTGLRILLIGFVVTRSIRKRLAAAGRRETVLAVGIAAGVAAVLGIAVSVASAAVFSAEQASMLNFAAVVLLWLVAGLSGALAAYRGADVAVASPVRGVRS